MSVPILHQTDLFHPHEDPDDHWDIACVFALAHAGHFDFRGVLIDYPPAGHVGAPDAMGIAQLNRISGLTVPFAVGSSVAVQRRGEGLDLLPVSERNGVQLVLRTLETAPSPVVITMVGSCRDVALAGAASPELFQKKCRAIYLNAGSGTRQPELLGELEYNVRLNAAAFYGIFDLPCPVYWMPCFEFTPPRWQVEKHGTWYRFTQSEILPHLSPRMQSYFAYMLSRSPSTDWLGALRSGPDAATLAAFGVMPRNMWCTAGFFHATGQTVTGGGEIVPLAESEGRAVFSFDPIETTHGNDGIMRWQPATDMNSRRYIFHVRDQLCYASAMTCAMRTLLATLP